MNKIRRLFRAMDDKRGEESGAGCVEQFKSTSDSGSDWIHVAPRLNAFWLIPCFLHFTLLLWEEAPHRERGLHPGLQLPQHSLGTHSHFRAFCSSCSQSTTLQPLRIYYIFMSAAFFCWRFPPLRQSSSRMKLSCHVVVELVWVADILLLEMMAFDHHESQMSERHFSE